MARQRLPVRLTKRFAAHDTGGVLNFKFSRNSRYCLTCGQDGIIKLWNPWNQNLLKQYSGCHNGNVNDVVSFRDNSKFVSVGDQGYSVLWDILSGERIRKFEKQHSGKITCCTLIGQSTDAVYLTGSTDKTVKLWDARQFNRYNAAAVQVLDQAKDAITSIGVTDNEIVTGSLDGFIRSYDVRKGVLSSLYVMFPISSLALSHDSEGACAAVGCLDSTIRLIDRHMPEDADEPPLATFRGHRNSSLKVSHTMDCGDKLVFGSSEDGSIYIWDIATPKPDQYLHIIPNAHHGGACNGVVFANENVETLEEIHDRKKLREAAQTKTYFGDEAGVELKVSTLISYGQDGHVCIWEQEDDI